ncbi:unnamed protein product [Paramecium sonneborni]|uniref:Uncharacterized protein n=1 Tax=Paramecium sonneborni TaxID=65129 RepID=A0A8S1QX40_9CILI|nr:unnamed protein product [Paramecium sonneborni]
MSSFNLLNNNFMQSAMERKSLRSIQFIQKNLDGSTKSISYEIWDQNDGLDSPMTPKIKLPRSFQPKLIKSVRNQIKKKTSRNKLT